MDKKRKDITSVVEQYLCHSCGSCFTSCGHDSISYYSTVGGYLFPKINYDTCTNCGLCYDICPGDHFVDYLKKQTPGDPFVGNIYEAYVGKATDSRIYKNSQSGGAVTAILKNLLDSGEITAAIVTGMNMYSDSYSEAKIVTTAEELISAQKSKYIPTTINFLLQKIEKLDGTIAIVGLPCHMHGLENLLTIKRKLKNKFIKIGLICDRVMLTSSVDFLTQRITKDKIKDFTFRDTSTTSYPGDITVKTENNKLKKLDKMSRVLMKDYFTPVRCLLCFDKMNIYSDIVIGDPHGVKGVDKIFGESLVLIRTETGQIVLDKTLKTNNIKLKIVSKFDAVEGQLIDMKKKKLSSYLKAWKGLGYNLPDYPKDIEKYLFNTTEKEVNFAKKHIKHSLFIDMFDNKKILLMNASRYYAIQLFKHRVKTPFRLLKNLLKKYRI